MSKWESTDRSKGRSPYVRRNKRPYAYSHKNCAHRDTVEQKTATWHGTVCRVCNIIRSKFGPEGAAT